MKNNNLTSKKKKKQNIPKKVTRAKLDEDIHVSKILRFHKPTSRFVVQWKSNSDPVKTKLWKQVKYHTLETLDHLIVNNIINPMVTEFISANVTAQRYIEAYLVDHPNVHHLVSTTTTTTKTPLPSLKASNLSMTDNKRKRKSTSLVASKLTSPAANTRSKKNGSYGVDAHTPISELFSSPGQRSPLLDDTPLGKKSVASTPSSSGTSFFYNISQNMSRRCSLPSEDY